MADEVTIRFTRELRIQMIYMDIGKKLKIDLNVFYIVNFRDPCHEKVVKSNKWNNQYRGMNFNYSQDNSHLKSCILERSLVKFRYMWIFGRTFGVIQA